ncbi:hypothetical protein GCM10029963_28360 [Micromonospora andamanensis]|uniref:hypothetical protein n=1 Tax=Micromonospora andamanensis TaxID=1287068 RepID=UPI00194F6047|nr:hypothetical protein [Micromonospora andamanensis]GIJ38532.1 hypothetical protein Vwe01_18570 [Micromonospora andamanensis]
MTTWTIAYRKPRANHFKRAANFSGTWHQAREAAALFLAANPGMQVYYVTTAEQEQAEAAEVAAGKLSADYALDHGNILTDAGKRVRIRETGELPAEIAAAVPSAAVAENRWRDGAY